MSEAILNDLAKITEMCLEKDKEIERLNNIIEDLKAILKSKGYEVMICNDIDNKEVNK